MRRFATAVVAVFLAATGSMVAQQELGARSNPLVPEKSAPRIYVGPVVGYNRTLHSSGYQSVAGDVLCPTFESGTANGFYVGGSFEYLLGKPRDSKSSIIARLLYNYLPGSYTEPGESLPVYNPASGDTVQTTVDHTAEIKYSVIDLEVMYKLNLFNSNFGITVGPTIGYVVGVSRQQYMNLVDPLFVTFERDPDCAECVYSNNDRTVMVADDDIPGHSAIRIAIKAGAQYEIPVGRILLVPSVYYNFGVTEVSAADNLRINAFQAGIDIRFAL